MNRTVRKVAVVCMVLFAALLVNANWLQVGEAGSLKSQPTNGRQITERLERQRGAIVAGDVEIARSVPSNDQYKYQRQYPAGQLYSNVTGYYTLFTAAGLERSEDVFLSGDDDRLLASRVTGLFTGAERRGGSVVTTINPAVQKAAAEALGNRKGAVVAIEPSTGAILAMVTNPSYDANALAAHDEKAAANAYGLLSGNPDQPLLNRAAQQTYPPGSTFKLITAAAALSQGRTPDTRVAAPDELPLPLSTVRLPNFGGERCGDGETDTLIHALAISCNTAFAQLGIDLGADTLRRQAEAFGLNATFPDFPLQQARSVFPAKLDAAQTAQSAIGQYDVRVTPLQMAEVVAAIANDGTEMKPYIVSELRSPDLKRISKTEPKKLGEPVSSEVAAQLTTMMESVVTSGTGRRAQIGGVTVAGKTGTAEHGTSLPHAWFVGFAPADAPKIAVAVIVEDGGGELGTGGAVAAPVAKQVIQAALDKP
ncbi:cell elongation-specific peptidoglycan D,D-transpeptidase [Frankia casuarinae]|jgi:peptidoglycan glycosyltransferase|uniref:Cell elongation-specific peptidoglycan D,D-transpeptidase n=3 Tax=Frankia casuarinae (strain DSM 45818 / CECT 9043 / HFP020203 / CcI3) TaxID=106370 RepID=Q2J4L2_FRACC|nr:penicillin-binding protein 2 [Frankia casuarinae]ABD13780.1 cell elongation-specific peptidoglycan D,D-transpeptidase [Frankia casuarinae]EYT90376.1 cell elongation-specific peptidoglycan D,D-transpeptidase [Frankia casuarinae]